MKNKTIRLCLFLAFIPGLSACKKNEQAGQKFETRQSIAKVENFVPSKVSNTKGAYFESIDTVCAPYLAYTKLININIYPDGYYPTISDGYLSLETSGSKYALYRERHHPFAWWTDWNKVPYVENQNPAVWVAFGYDGPMTIKLSEKCYVLGFELSAQADELVRGPFTFIVNYEDTDQQSNGTTIGSISNDVVAPFGARLYAIKSDIPFDKVEIRFAGSPSSPPGAWGITNIRYITDKAVYDAHK